MAQRYEMQKEPDGLWTVVDRFTGQPATPEGVPLIGLLIEDADGFVDLLNAKDLRDRQAKGIA